MKKWWCLLILAVALAFAWMIYRSNDLAGTTDAASSPNVKTVRTRERRVAESVNWRDFGRRAMEFSDEERGAFAKNLESKDRIRAMETLVEQAERDGLASHIKLMMEAILRDWANEDFDAAWSWIQQRTEATSRRFVMEVLLATLVPRNPERALALYLQEKEEYLDFDSSVPFSLLAAKTRDGADGFIDLFSKLPMGDGISLGTMEFAMDFDFQLAADGVVAAMKDRENMRPPVFPENFFKQWAMQDSEAAFVWWTANGSLPGNNWIELIIGVEKSSTPEAAGEWAADKWEGAEASREEMIRELTATTGRNNSIIQTIAESMSDRSVRDQFLTDILVKSHSSDPASTYQFAVPGISTPQARLETFRKMKAAGKSIDGESLTENHQAWGLTREQIDLIFADGNSSGRPQ